jgi:tRNA(Arg) A34 adenosine deaminase TadA
MIPKYLHLAAEYATRRQDERGYYLGAIGVRADGAIAHAVNGPALDRFPQAHAESRLARKLTPRSTVFVARVTRAGELAMARPCPDCWRSLGARGVERVVYSTGPNTFCTEWI